LLRLKVRKIGNSLGITLPKNVVQNLDTREGEYLFLLGGSDGSYYLTRYDPGFSRKVILAKNIMERYRNALHELAK